MSYKSANKNSADFALEKNTIDESEVLKLLLQNGTITMGDVTYAMKNKQLKEILSTHKYKIYQANDGRFCTYLPDPSKPNGRRKIAKSSEEKLHNALLEHYQSLSDQARYDSMTLYDLYPEWLDHKRLLSAAETYIIRINSDWKKYYLENEIIHIPIRALTKLQCKEWCHTIIKQFNMTKNQFYNCTVIIRQVLAYAVDLGIIHTSPMDLFKIDGRRLFRKPAKKSDLTQVYTDHELRQLKELAWSDYYNQTKRYQLAPLAVLFQFLTGLRIGEVLVLRYEDLIGNNGLLVRRMYRRDTKEIVPHTKSYEDRSIVITSEAIKVINAARKRQQELNVADDGYIFSITDEPPSYHSVADLYRKYCEMIGTIRKSSHKARKTYVSTLLQHDVPITTVMNQVGHTDARTTYNSYVYDRSTEQEKLDNIENALK